VRRLSREHVRVPLDEQRTSHRCGALLLRQRVRL
jgi:hypothetical protein